MQPETTERAPSTTARRAPIQAEMTVRQVAMDYPGCREVFQKYGEPERSDSKFGHIEPIERFAERRGLPLEPLLDELARASGVPRERKKAPDREPHRWFLLASLLITLTLGAGWGMLLLWRIGWEGQFTSVPEGQIVAHGEAQLWGFIGLFVAGITAGYLPILTARPKPGTIEVRLLLALLLGGVLLGFAWSLAPGEAGWLGPLSASLLVLGTLGYLGLVGWLVAEKWRTPWGRFLVASASWMVVWAAITLVLRVLAGASGPSAYGMRDRQILMDLAIFGFAMNAIYGFGQRLLPGLLRGGSSKQSHFAATWFLHNGGMAWLVLAWLAGLSGVAWLGSLPIAVGALFFASGLRGLVRGRTAPERPEAGPSLLATYIRLAFFWLLVGLLMLAGGDLAAAITGQAMPHAYQGALRHALTVGFMTTLILGVGQRLVPILGHQLLAWPALVGPILILIGIGNALRVGSELATLAWPLAFQIMPISAVLELAALSLFAANILGTLWPRPDPLLRTGRVTLRSSVACLLAEHPWLEDRMIAWGIRYLARVRSVPPELTLASMANGDRFDPEELIQRLNALLAESIDRLQTEETDPSIPAGS